MGVELFIKLDPDLFQVESGYGHIQRRRGSNSRICFKYIQEEGIFLENLLVMFLRIHSDIA